MTWTTPCFSEIKMDAEIGSYQDDFDRPGEAPLFVAMTTNEGDAPAE
jgi:hypothetical protein